MERIGYDLKYGYIFKHQNEAGTLVYLRGIGWVGKAAQPTMLRAAIANCVKGEKK